MQLQHLARNPSQIPELADVLRWFPDLWHENVPSAPLQLWNSPGFHMLVHPQRPEGRVTITRVFLETEDSFRGQPQQSCSQVEQRQGGPPGGRMGMWSQRRHRRRQLAVVIKQSCSNSSTHCLGDTWLPPMNKEFIWLQSSWSLEPHLPCRNDSPLCGYGYLVSSNTVAQPRPGMQQILKKYLPSEQTNEEAIGALSWDSKTSSPFEGPNKLLSSRRPFQTQGSTMSSTQDNTEPQITALPSQKSSNASQSFMTLSLGLSCFPREIISSWKVGPKPSLSLVSFHGVEFNISWTYLRSPMAPWWLVTGQNFHSLGHSSVLEGISPFPPEWLLLGDFGRDACYLHLAEYTGLQDGPHASIVSLAVNRSIHHIPLEEAA